MQIYVILKKEPMILKLETVMNLLQLHPQAT